MEQVKVKSGYLTSEFALTLANFIGGGAVMLGYLTPQQADDFGKAVVSVLGGVMVILSTVVYIVGRIKLKQPSTVTSTTTTSVPVVEKVETLEVEPQFVPR